MKLILFFSKKRKNRIFFMSFDFFRKKKNPHSNFSPKSKTDSVFYSNVMKLVVPPNYTCTFKSQMVGKGR